MIFIFSGTRFTWEHRLHRCQKFSVVVHPQMQESQGIEVRTHLSELSQRCLEIVGLNRQVVVVGGCRALAFVQIGQLPLWIGTAMIHVVP